MPFKIIVTNTSDEADGSSDTFVFHQERVVVGRDPSNDLHLGDDRRVVSKQHAEIVQQGKMFQVTDLGSKNFTYLNGDRVKANKPYDVGPGDTIRVGDFELALEVIEHRPEPKPAPVQDYDHTVFDVSFINPFNEGATLLAAALGDLAKHYDEVAPSRREDALRDALRETLNDDQQQALAQAAHILGLAASPGPAAEPPPVAAKPPVAQPPPVAPQEEKTPRPPPALMPDSPRLYRLLDTSLDALAGLLMVPWQFRHEFIGQTIMQTEERAFLYAGEGEALKSHILDLSISEDKANERLGLLEEAAEEVALHQVALLDGYKAAVHEGAKRLIDQLNPDEIEDAVAKESVLYRILRPLAKAEALARLRNQLQEMRNEDWSAAEARTYRPPFIKSYLARMTSRRGRGG